MGSGSSTDQKALKRGIKSNDVKAVFELLRSGVNADLPIDPVWEHTPLILATCYGAQDVLPLLLRVCKRKDSCNYEGHTALDKGIIYYSLACQFFQHKPIEIEKRRVILQLLIEGGCRRVKVPDIELWIKENRRDEKFIESMVNLFCVSTSCSFKSIGLATMIRHNVNPDYVRQMLESGAGLKYYIKTCHLNDDFIFDASYSHRLSDATAELLIRASHSSITHNHIVSLKLRDSRRESKAGPALSNSFSRLLAEVGFSLNQSSIEDQKELRSLMELCRNSIRSWLVPNVLFGVKHLSLPLQLQRYITLDHT